VFAIPMAWFEGKLVFYLVYTLFYLHRIAFHIYLIYLCFTYYTNLYLIDYSCHCARVSRDEIGNSFMLDFSKT
jgi:hypothetical protein